ncbi:conserved protein of unknown function [Rhodovastum atsumiense]|uniref:Protein kinase domain-containing protein n=1 Tax=Rhodovastum atsumiense TaxID=504468 RepID=A0A5M6IZJ9_9PROT|nr:hypothetical protein [Rhodovastum atsumiense]KAA5613389.1 hypothetical protein F1189_04830 [Rhodovastum atsumiense]CAH2603078.1 conserved protein of unknown function [Rhodovastum atsumiense]
MRFPAAADYNELVQVPGLCFTDAEITRRVAVTDALGLPVPVSGASALTYRFAGPGPDIAVRCFTREIPDLFARYAAISAFLERLGSRFFVPFTFLAQGLRQGRAALPVIRMEWIEGPTLLDFVRAHRADRAALRRLRGQVLDFALEQKRYGYAHGDVQPRNILVDAAGRLRFVDYDGMFVPGMPCREPADLGHRDFQSPRRGSGDFAPHLDRFALIALELSLHALELCPDLLVQFDPQVQEDAFILRRSDYADPAASPALAAMEMLPGLARPVAAFRELCALPLERLPTLDAVCGRPKLAFFRDPWGALRQGRRTGRAVAAPGVAESVPGDAPGDTATDGPSATDAGGGQRLSRFGKWVLAGEMPGTTPDWLDPPDPPPQPPMAPPPRGTPPALRAVAPAPAPRRRSRAMLAAAQSWLGRRRWP